MLSRVESSSPITLRRAPGDPPSTPSLASICSSSSNAFVADSVLDKRWPSLTLLVGRRAEQSSVDSDDDADRSSTASADASRARVDEYIDFMLEHGAQRLCDLMPVDTLCCRCGADTWRCEPVGVYRLVDVVGVERTYIKFSQLLDCEPTAARECTFTSPNGIVATRWAKLSECERDVWYNSELIGRADRCTATAFGGCFVSLMVEASQLMLRALQSYCWAAPEARTLAAALAHDGWFDDARDIGFLFLDYLFAVLQQRPSYVDIDEQVDRLFESFSRAWRARRSAGDE